MHGGTQLSAVYYGSTPIWIASIAPPSVQLLNTYYAKASSGTCMKGTLYNLYFHGVHNINDPGRQYTCQYREPINGQWYPTNFQDYWSADYYTQPLVEWNLECIWIYQCNESGAPYRHQGRIKFRLSDGTELDWVSAPPAFFDADEEYPEVFIGDPPNESEIEDG